MLESTKVAFSSFDDKRYFLCEKHSVPYGSALIHRFAEEEEPYVCDFWDWGCTLPHNHGVVHSTTSYRYNSPPCCCCPTEEELKKDDPKNSCFFCSRPDHLY